MHWYVGINARFHAMIPYEGFKCPSFNRPTFKAVVEGIYWAPINGSHCRAIIELGGHNYWIQTGGLYVGI